MVQPSVGSSGSVDNVLRARLGFNDRLEFPYAIEKPAAVVTWKIRWTRLHRMPMTGVEYVRNGAGTLREE
jgi:hypothetical protein